MSANQGTRSITDFAAKHGLSRQTVADILNIRELPIEKMQHGRAKGLSPQTQRRVLKILGIKPGRQLASAS